MLTDGSKIAFMPQEECLLGALRPEAYRIRERRDRCSVTADEAASEVDMVKVVLLCIHISASIVSEAAQDSAKTYAI